MPSAYSFPFRKGVTRHVVVEPVDNDEAPGGLLPNEVPAWAFNAAELTVVVAPDGLSADVTPLVSAVTSVITVSAQNSANQHITTSMDCVIGLEPATKFKPTIS